MALPTLPEKWGSKEVWLRALYVRASIIWYFRDEFTDLELGALESLGPLLEEVYRITSEEAVRSDRVDEALCGAVERVQHEIDHLIDSHGEDDELRRLKKLVEEAQASDVLQQIFDCISGLTRSVYHSPPCRKAILLPEWLNKHPRGLSHPIGYPDPYHVNAQTRVASNTAYVELQIHLDRFDVFSLLVVPALLTHELVCHAYAQEDRNDDKSYWAEGVMDWAASFFFEMWAVRLELPYGVAKAHGMRLWDQRMTHSRYAGRLAADTLVDWLVNDLSIGVPQVAQMLTAKLALQVNVVDAPLRHKDRLASRLANIKRDKALQGAIRAWDRDELPAADLLA